jgi:membrane associated rhomboid family serine protease
MTKFNKAWVSALVSFLAMSAANFFGFEISVEVQAAVVGVITGILTWLVPNTPAA